MEGIKRWIYRENLWWEITEEKGADNFAAACKELPHPIIAGNNISVLHKHA